MTDKELRAKILEAIQTSDHDNVYADVDAVEQLCKDYARGVANEVIGDDEISLGKSVSRYASSENFNNEVVRDSLRKVQRQKLTERLGK